MKKVFSNFIASVLAVSLFSNVSSACAMDANAAESEYRDSYTLFGDLNSDSSIDGYDIILMRKAVAGKEYSKIADINCDQKVDENDLNLLSDYVLGKSFLLEAYVRDDTDEDGICDVVEAISLKSDPDSVDTDNDGLSDYFELIYSSTDPLVADSVEKGVSDSEIDFDEDGLTNAEEQRYSTDPHNIDTDNDELDDFYEVKTLKTDPLKKDSDCDGLTDFEEEKLGLDPLNEATDGTPDNKRIIKQVIEADDPLLKKINTEDNAYELSIEVNASGYAPKCLKAFESGYSYALKDGSAIGVAPEFTYNSSYDVESIILNFKIKEEFRDNVSHYFDDIQDDYYEYSYAVDPELEGIKRLNVFKYFETVNVVMPIETYFDLDNYTVSAKIDKFETDDEGNSLGIGSYSLVDLEVWAEMLNETEEDANEIDSEEVSIDEKDTVSLNSRIEILANESHSVYNKLVQLSDAAQERISKNYQSHGSRNGNSVGSGTKIMSFFGHKYAYYDAKGIAWAAAKADCRAKGGHLMTINSPFEFNFLNNKLSQGRRGGLYWLGAAGGSGKWKWITGESTSYARTISVSGYTMDRCENYFSALDNHLAYCPELAYLSEGFPSYSKINGYICEWEPGAKINDPESNMVSANVGSGSQVVLNDTLSPDSKVDSDGDGIPDWDEVDHDAIGRVTGDENKPSMPLSDVLQYLQDKGYTGNNRGIIGELINKHPKDVTPTVSNITSDDSDEDGIKDKNDTAPNRKGLYNPGNASDPIIGELTIAASSAGAGDTGHAWLVLKSFCNDTITIEVDNYVEGHRFINQALVDDDENERDPYPLSMNENIVIGNFSLGSGFFDGTTMAIITLPPSHCDNAGLCYNKEFYFDWPDASGFTRSISESQLEALKNYLMNNSWYNLYTHNCSTVALGAWEAAFGTTDGMDAATYAAIGSTLGARFGSSCNTIVSRLLYSELGCDDLFAEIGSVAGIAVQSALIYMSISDQMYLEAYILSQPIDTPSKLKDTIDLKSGQVGYVSDAASMLWDILDGGGFTD